MERVDEMREKLTQPVIAVKGVGTKTAGLLERKGLATVEDLLYFLPRRYEDRRFPVNIERARPGIRENIVATVSKAEIRYFMKRPVFEATIEDGTGRLKLKWFRGNANYLRGIFKTGQQVIVSGNISQFQLQKEMLHPDFELLDEGKDNSLHFKRIVPIYSEMEGIYQKNLRRIMWQTVHDYLSCVLSPIPEWICRKHQLIDMGEALRQVHFPAADQNLEDYNAGCTLAHR
ncbi:MAG: OB-fold nucleic acid binding domain-containing protein, partial [Syntrophales bacterium LBB04]|nr:OB-fold nucleic acid binding domain-containing protein [Syntrophales bacterium LBB04]